MNAPQMGPKKRNPNLRRDGTLKLGAQLRECFQRNGQVWADNREALRTMLHGEGT